MELMDCALDIVGGDEKTAEAFIETVDEDAIRLLHAARERGRSDALGLAKKAAAERKILDVASKRKLDTAEGYLAKAAQALLDKHGDLEKTAAAPDRDLGATIGGFPIDVLQTRSRAWGNINMPSGGTENHPERYDVEFGPDVAREDMWKSAAANLKQLLG